MIFNLENCVISGYGKKDSEDLKKLKDPNHLKDIFRNFQKVSIELKDNHHTWDIYIPTIASQKSGALELSFNFYSAWGLDIHFGDKVIKYTGYDNEDRYVKKFTNKYGFWTEVTKGNIKTT